MCTLTTAPALLGRRTVPAPASAAHADPNAHRHTRICTNMRPLTTACTNQINQSDRTHFFLPARTTTMKASQKTPILIASGVVAALAVALTGAVVFAKKGKGDGTCARACRTGPLGA